MFCICYRRLQKRDADGHLYMQGYCIGTREQDDCWCGGDRAKCTFYPEYRNGAPEKPRITMTKAEAEEKFNIKIVEDENR